MAVSDDRAMIGFASFIFIWCPLVAEMGSGSLVRLSTLPTFCTFMSHQILSEAYRWDVAAFHAVLRNFMHKHVFTCCLTVFFFLFFLNKQTLFWWLLLNLLTSGNIRKKCRLVLYSMMTGYFCCLCVYVNNCPSLLCLN